MGIAENLGSVWTSRTRNGQNDSSLRRDIETPLAPHHENLTFRSLPLSMLLNKTSSSLSSLKHFMARLQILKDKDIHMPTDIKNRFIT
jgi:hypothetical protein